MLILERRPGQSVKIRCGDKTIVVQFTSLRSRDIIKLGFDADPDVVIWRAELGEWHREPPEVC